MGDERIQGTLIDNVLARQLQVLDVQRCKLAERRVYRIRIGYLSPTPRKGKYKRRLICGGVFQAAMPMESRSQTAHRAKS